MLISGKQKEETKNWLWGGMVQPGCELHLTPAVGSGSLTPARGHRTAGVCVCVGGSCSANALPSSFSDEQGAPAWCQPQTLIWSPKVERRGSSKHHRTPGTSLLWKEVGGHQEFPITLLSGAYQVAQW